MRGCYPLSRTPVKDKPHFTDILNHSDRESYLYFVNEDRGFLVCGESIFMCYALNRLPVFSISIIVSP